MHLYLVYKMGVISMILIFMCGLGAVRQRSGIMQVDWSSS